MTIRGVVVALFLAVLGFTGAGAIASVSAPEGGPATSAERQEGATTVASEPSGSEPATDANSEPPAPVDSASQAGASGATDSSTTPSSSAATPLPEAPKTVTARTTKKFTRALDAWEAAADNGDALKIPGPCSRTKTVKSGRGDEPRLCSVYSSFEVVDARQAFITMTLPPTVDELAYRCAVQDTANFEPDVPLVAGKGQTVGLALDVRKYRAAIRVSCSDANARIAGGVQVVFFARDGDE